MANPIIDTTDILLRQLDARTIADARDAIRVRSLESTGEVLGLEESINLIKGAKYLAAADGLSNAETTGLKLLLRKYGMPDLISEHVLKFDVARVESRHIGELVPTRSRRGCFLLSGMISIAALDGLSDEELDGARKAGAALGLEPKLVTLIVAEAKASVYGVLKGDQSLLGHLMEVRRAIFAMVES
jgi:hypothetical protein